MAKQATKKKTTTAAKPAAKRVVAKKKASAKTTVQTKKGSVKKTSAATSTKTTTAKKPAKSVKSPVKKSVTKKTPTASKTQAESKSASKPKAPAKKAPAKKKASRARKSAIVVPADYHPTDDEPFMNDLQREYFRLKLVNWKDEIIRQTKETLEGLNQDSQQHADLADRATSETDRALELRARDRQRKLVNKINAALSRIEDGSYGYCEETGEPIGLKRLDARPIATLSLEAQERHERRERVYRED